MGFSEAIRSGFANCFKFSGRATRPEYWYFTLLFVLCNFTGDAALTLGDPAPGSAGRVAYYIWQIVLLVLLVPHAAVGIRRLHDTDHSGWWYGCLLISGAVVAMASHQDALIAPVLSVIALILWLVLLVWLMSRGTAGANRFGPAKTSVPVSA